MNIASGSAQLSPNTLLFAETRLNTGAKLNKGHITSHHILQLHSSPCRKHPARAGVLQSVGQWHLVHVWLVETRRSNATVNCVPHIQRHQQQLRLRILTLSTRNAPTVSLPVLNVSLCPVKEVVVGERSQTPP